MLEGLNKHDNADASLWGQEPWITEGIAEYIANRDHGGPAGRRSGARDLRRTGQFPSAMPQAITFYGFDDRTTNANYYVAHQAMRHIAKKYGEKKLFAFVAAYYGGATIADAARTHLDADANALQRDAVAFARADL